MTIPDVAAHGTAGTQARCVNGDTLSTQVGQDSAGPSSVTR